MMSFPKTPRLTRWIIAAAVAAAGAATMVVILVILGDLEDDGAVMIVSAALGAGLAGLLFAGMFGRMERKRDWGFFALGAVLATSLGSFLGGAIWGVMLVIFKAAPSDEFLPVVILKMGGFGFMVVMFLMPTEQPGTVAVWVLIMLSAQAVSVWARRYRTAA